ncbi:MAG: transposase, partial [Thiohalocapsa sp.]
ADGDRGVFLDVLDSVWERFNWVLHAYCLMTNHYHLLVETPDANLAKGMRQLNGVYTQRFNRTYNRSGHVFQGRYKAILAQKEAYLLELARYVVLNPVRARMVRTPADWPWSSYQAMIGEEPAPEWLETRTILAAFGETESEAVAHYARFVAEGKGQPAPWEQLKNQVFLGSDSFVESMRRQLPQKRDLREVPQAKRRPTAKPLPEYAREHLKRNDAIVAAYRSGGYTLRDIGDFFGIHYSRVSKIVQAADVVRRQARGKTPDPM